MFGVLNAVALLRFGDALDWSSARAWLFAAFLASTVVVGLAARRRDTPGQTAPLRQDNQA